MMNKNVKGILALAVVTALSFGVIAGSNALSQGMAVENGTGTAAAEEVKVLEELDTAGFDNIEKAVKTENGYLVTVRTKGYGGDIVMDVAFDAEGKKVTGVTVVEQSETEGLGAKIAETEFLSQFEGVEAPVYLPGMAVASEDEADEEETQTVDELEGAVFADGTYVAKTPEADDNGFVESVTMTVADGKITEVVWEAETEDGAKKSVMSENGEYTMTEDGLTWKEQAEALGAALVEGQSLNAVGMNAQGKTDAVSGVSIYIGGFAGLAEQCMKEAAGLTAPAAVLNDGTYEARTEEADDNGFVDVVTMTVAGGKITEVNWDCVTEDGTKKSVMSENGEYTMTEDGLTWKEQAEALGAALVEGQSIDAVGMNEQGKTDAVSGVSIYVGGFVGLAEQCLVQAAGETAEAVVLNDGTYEAKTAEADKNGFIGMVTMTVADGKITEVNWDYETEDGAKKSVMSENGEYVMTEDGPTWKEQAEALAAALIENQSLDFFTMDEQGKTDAVAGVSISIGDFVSLSEQCLTQAAGEEVIEENTVTEMEVTTEESVEEVQMEGTLVDAVSGATISSTAAVTGINAAYEFLNAAK